MDGMTCDMGLLVVLASNTGNTRTFLEFLDKHSENNLHICDDFVCDLHRYDRIAFGSYTWRNGKIPEKMKDFLIENHHALQGKEVFIFGSGNSIYPKFCGAVDGIAKICSDSGAIIKSTFKFEQRFDTEEYSGIELDKLIRDISYWSK